MAVVSLDMAKRRLRLGDDISIPMSSFDQDIQDCLDEAEATVLNRVKQLVSGSTDWAAVVDAWTEQTVPLEIRSAILQQTAEVYRFRGDDLAIDLPRREPGGLSPAVEYLVKRFFDPAVA